MNIIIIDQWGGKNIKRSFKIILLGLFIAKLNYERKNGVYNNNKDYDNCKSVKKKKKSGEIHDIVLADYFD